MRRSAKREKILFTLRRSGLSTVDELAEKLPDIDPATIYRNLEKFCFEGTVREIRIKKGISSYELIKDKHQHLICTNCQEIKAIKVNQEKILSHIKNLNPWLKSYEIENIEINIRARSKKVCTQI